MSKSLALLCLSLPLFLASCITHRVSFAEIQPTASSTKQLRDVVAVIDVISRQRTVRVRSAMAGWAHKWDVEAGTMLVQMANTELPPMFEHYTLAEAPPAPAEGADRIVLELTLSDFQFADFKATVTLVARALDPQGKELFARTYTEFGQAQGGKVVWGGAFAMQSAIRQSSHDAFTKIFAALAKDLAPPSA